MSDESVIAKAKDMVDATRDLVFERLNELNLKTAKQLFETPYDLRGELQDFDKELKSILFETAVNESLDSSGKPIWGSAFNSYASLLELVRVIRTPGEFKGSPSGALVKEVEDSSNRLASIFAIFRKNKNLTALESQQMLELAMSTSISGLSDVARKAVYEYAEEHSGEPFELINQYLELCDIVARVKRPFCTELA